MTLCPLLLICNDRSCNFVQQQTTKATRKFSLKFPARRLHPANNLPVARAHGMHCSRNKEKRQSGGASLQAAIAPRILWEQHCLLPLQSGFALRLHVSHLHRPVHMLHKLWATMHGYCMLTDGVIGCRQSHAIVAYIQRHSREQA
jgi:hypothetical protein